MSTDAKEFLKCLVSEEMTHLERGVALLWFYGLEDDTAALSAGQLAREIEEAGYTRPNVTNLKSRLRKDKRTVKTNTDAFRIKIDAEAVLGKRYLDYVKNRPIPDSSSLLPVDLFKNTRGYLEKVVKQVNVSYDYSLFDCCAVMCRRLVETLIIEVYETRARSSEIKDADGNFLMLKGLLSQFEKDGFMNLGREAKKGLVAFKKLGDLSAHNRRYNARKDDIDRVRDGLRIAVEELINLWKAQECSEN